jgi:DNA-directed RNA polymerase specialized sigma24 family protein
VAKGGSKPHTKEEFVDAYVAMPEAEQVRLLRKAELLAFKTNMSPDDLLSEAATRTIEGERNWSGDLPLPVYLYGVMRSIADAERKSLRKQGERVGIDALVEVGAEPPSTSRNSEELMIAAEEYAVRNSAILSLFDDDEEALMVIMGDLDEVSAEDLRQMLGVDKTAFASIRRRARRKLASAYPSGWRAL